MKKLFFLSAFLLILPLQIIAADPNQQLTDEQCAGEPTSGGQGGLCKIILTGDGCDGDQLRVGKCEAVLVAQYACCVPNNGQALTKTMCEAPVSQGGKGGMCLSGTCGNNSVGVCGENLIGEDGHCCVSQETINNAEGAGAGVIADTSSSTYGDYQLLEQIPGSPNTSGDLKPYLESLYKAGFVLIVIGAIFMIGFGGFTYMASAGNTSMIKKGKGMITDAIIGLVAALCIWLILNIINPDLVNLKIDPLPQTKFTANQAGGTPAGQQTPAGATTGTFAAKLYTNDLFVDAQARKYFSDNGVSVNKGDCSSPSQTDCTSLGEFPSPMAGAIVGIKRSCNCDVTVTGGTEAGHSTHGKGRAAADIRKTSALDAFFAQQTPAGNSGGKPIYQVGIIKVWFEDNAHYHIWQPAN